MPSDPVRLPWSRTARPIPRRIVQPLQTFMGTEAAGGIALLAAASVALVWANSPWREAYHSLWDTRIAIGLGARSLDGDLRHWVNEALMAVFFLVVGLEIKRELLTGELRGRRAAALPAFGALGGMALPAILYLAVNPSGDAARGWGIPMATDIAFALGVLAVVGRGIPAGAKVFLLALAIADDIGAIAVIAIAYTDSLDPRALALAAGLLGAVAVLVRAGVRALWVYVPLAVGAWVAMLQSGVHATIAGVALGLLTPARPFQPPSGVSGEAHRIANETLDEPPTPDADAPLWLDLAALSREAVSPLARFERALHPWTSFLFVPAFALANAGITLGDVRRAATSPVALGVVAGLAAGKVAGIAGAAWLSTRLRLARLPEGTRWADIVAVATLGGIGFTVSLFVAGLAFDSEDLRDQATAGVLAASVLSAVAGAAALRWARRGP